MLASRIIRRSGDVSWLGADADPLLQRLVAVCGEAWQPLRRSVLDAIAVICVRIASIAGSEAIRSRTSTELERSSLYRLGRAEPTALSELIRLGFEELSRIRQALERARESLDEVRRSVLDLRAGPLERQTIEAALEALGRRFADETGIAVTTRIDLAGLRLPARSEEALYRIAQEALANVRRHAQAGAVEIDLRVVDEHVGVLHQRR